MNRIGSEIDPSYTLARITFTYIKKHQLRKIFLCSAAFLLDLKISVPLAQRLQRAPRLAEQLQHPGWHKPSAEDRARHFAAKCIFSYSGRFLCLNPMRWKCTLRK